MTLRRVCCFSPLTVLLVCSLAAATSVSITTTSLPSGISGKSYSKAVSAAGGTTPYGWSIASGALPAGLSLDPSTGIISGTPTVAGPSSFTVKVVDSSSTPQSASQKLAINVWPPRVITTTSLSDVVVGAASSETISATGGRKHYTFKLVSGALPAGLTLSSSTGAIAGTPTAVGTSTFSVRVSDSASTTQRVTATLSITVVNPPTVTTTAVPNGAVGMAYGTSLGDSGGTSPYTWSMPSGALPGGLTLAATTGNISGTPNTSGSFAFTAQVTDSSATPQSARQSLTIKVQPQLVLTTTTLAAGTVGTGYSQGLGASGGVPPYKWTVTAGSLPAGLILGSTGTISGTPTTANTYNFTVRVTDSGPPKQSATKALSITINPSGATASGILYVAGNALGSVYSWNNASTVSGSTAPNRTVSPSFYTKLDVQSPFGLFVDTAANQLYIVNNSVFVTGLLIFNNASTVSGSTTFPSRTLTGPFDALIRTAAVDTTRNMLYVTDGNIVFIWANASSVNGTPKPTAMLSGSKTGLQFAFGASVDIASDELYIADLGSKAIRVWSNASRLTGAIAPTRVLAGSNTQLVTPYFAAVDTKRNILYVGNGTSILVWDNASNVSGNVAPSRVISGLNTQLGQTCQMSVDEAHDTLYVGSGSSTFTKVLAFTSASTSSGNLAPSRVITTASTSPCGAIVDTTR